MSYLKKEATRDLDIDYVSILNVVVKPLGLVFTLEGSEIVLSDNNGKLIEKTALSSDVTMFSCKIPNGEELNFYYNAQCKNTVISLGNSCSNKTEIYFSHGHNGQEVFVTSLVVSLDNDTYNIDYSRTDGYLSFIKNDGKKSTCVRISRSQSEQTSLMFSNVSEEDIYSITSTGDESYHKIMQQCGLRDKTFSVTYTEKHINGKEITIDQSNNPDFMHYSNAKLLNNEKVRAILDEVLRKYDEIFSRELDENGLLGGYLYNAYLNGEPNNKVKAIKFLDSVGIQTQAQQRKKGKRKKEN
jgi:hypothetical protein